MESVELYAVMLDEYHTEVSTERTNISRILCFVFETIEKAFQYIENVEHDMENPYFDIELTGDSMYDVGRIITYHYIPKNKNEEHKEHTRIMQYWVQPVLLKK